MFRVPQLDHSTQGEFAGIRKIVVEREGEIAEHLHSEACSGRVSKADTASGQIRAKTTYANLLINRVRNRNHGYHNAAALTLFCYLACKQILPGVGFHGKAVRQKLPLVLDGILDDLFRRPPAEVGL